MNTGKGCERVVLTFSMSQTLFPGGKKLVCVNVSGAFVWGAPGPVGVKPLHSSLGASVSWSETRGRGEGAARAPVAEKLFL